MEICPILSDPDEERLPGIDLYRKTEGAGANETTKNTSPLPGVMDPFPGIGDPAGLLTVRVEPLTYGDPGKLDLSLIKISSRLN